MTRLLTILLLMHSVNLNAQNSDSDQGNCSVIVLNSGLFRYAKIIDDDQSKVTYRGCCEDCNVTIRLTKNKIDTIIYNTGQESYEAELAEYWKNNGFDSSGNVNNSALVFTKKGKKHEWQINNGSRVKIETKDGLTLKGHVFILDSNHVKMKRDVFELNEIASFSKPSIAGKVSGATSLLFSAAATGAMIYYDYNTWLGLLIGSGSIAGSSTLFLIKKKFDLTEKWNVRVEQ